MSELWADPVYRHHNPPLSCRLGWHSRMHGGRCGTCGHISDADLEKEQGDDPNLNDFKDPR